MSAESTKTISFIGAGNMAYALVQGLQSSDNQSWQIRVADPFPNQLEKYAATHATTFADNNAAIHEADVIVLAVKPQVAGEVLEALDLAPQQLLISIAAGINITSLHSWTHAEQAIIRCMPNTPALIQAGATGLYANSHVTNTQKDLAQEIINAVGTSLWVQAESNLDAVTAVSGSGPAYFFLLMEAMVNAGVELGLTKSEATELTLQTAYGAARMAQQSEEEPSTLRHNVTSPGGTTAAALAVMQEGLLPETIQRALGAADRRAAELAEEFGS